MAKESKTDKKEKKEATEKKGVDKSSNEKKTETKKDRQKTLSDRKKTALYRLNRKSRAQKSRKRRKKKRSEYDVRLVSIRRVSKVKAGGKRLRMSVMAVIGDHKGRVGVGLAKGIDVRDAQGKAVNKAKKNMIKVAMKGQTIPHEIKEKFGAALVLLKPAAPGTGVIAGGAVRSVVELAGIKDILSKIIGTTNTIPNVYATFEALKKLRLTRFPKEK